MTTKDQVIEQLMGAIMGAAYDFRDAHISGSANLKRSAHAELETATKEALSAAKAVEPQPERKPLTDGQALNPIDTIRYWANAYSDPKSGEHFLGHGKVAELLNEYAALREKNGITGGQQ